MNTENNTQETQGTKEIASLGMIADSKYYTTNFLYYPLDNGEVMILDSANLYEGYELVNCLKVGDQFKMFRAR